MRTVTLLTQDDCRLCEDAKAVLAKLSIEQPLRVLEVPFGSAVGRELSIRHGILFAPGVLLDDVAFGHGRLSERKLRRALQAPAG